MTDRTPPSEPTTEQLLALGLAVYATQAEAYAMGEDAPEDTAGLAAALLAAGSAWEQAEQAARAAGLTHAADEAAAHGSAMTEQAAEIAMAGFASGDPDTRAALQALGLMDAAEDEQDGE